MTDSLLSRLQSLTGPSREIDAEIALVFGWTRGRFKTTDHYWRSPDGDIHPCPRSYTADTDTALALKPKAAMWRLDSSFNGQVDRFEAWLWDGAPPDDIVTCGYGPTPAIALLIAILKAKEEPKP